MRECFFASLRILLIADLILGMDNSSISEKSGDTVAREGFGVKRHLVKTAGLVGLMTLASRILGMIRDIVSAKTFGTRWQWDAFIYAFMLPNFLRRLVGEGALSSAFIPVYSEIQAQKGHEEAFRFAYVIRTFLITILAGFLILSELALFALLQIPDLAPTLHLTLDLLRIFFPYLALISLFSLGMGILNCHKHFFASSLGPVILDLVWIAAVLWWVPGAGPDLTAQVRVLSWAILFSGVLQLAALSPQLWQVGIRPAWVWDRLYPGLKKTVSLLVPGILAFAVVQINILVDMTLAFMIGPGANSSLWYGTRLMQFPLGVFAIAMGTALLPTMAHQAARQEFEAARKTLSFALRSVFLIILPSSIGLIMLRTPIIQLLFERGEFNAVSTARSAAVLMCYSFGLFAYSGQKIIASGFYAIQDPRTPVRIGVIALVTNIILNLILMKPLREAGLALATSVSGIVQFLLLALLYEKKTVNFPRREILLSFFKILGASLVMGVIAVFAFRFLEAAYPGKGTTALLVQVLGSISVATLTYIALCFLFRVHEMHEAVNWLRRKRK